MFLNITVNHKNAVRLNAYVASVNGKRTEGSIKELTDHYTQTLLALNKPRLFTVPTRESLRE